MKALDQFTIEHEPIAPIDLMERASHAFVHWFVQHVWMDKKIGIVCGMGNNGGDGLAIARLLNERGYRVNVWIVRGEVNETESFKINLKRISEKISLYEIATESDRGLFTGCDVLIDAVFGSGLSRAPKGIYAQVISCINQTDALKIAVDIPSGLFADAHSEESIVKADYTISFQLPKLAFLFPENHAYVGEWHLVDIGLSKEFIWQERTSYFYVDAKAVKKIIRPREKFSHKGNYGHALLIAGSQGKMGASILAAKAALRSGLGLLTVHVPLGEHAIIQSAVPEAMASIDSNKTIFSHVSERLNYTTLGVGPGLRTDAVSANGFAAVLKNFNKPMVIDADGLNLLSMNKELLDLIPEGSILTPHPKEFERLVGPLANDFDRLDLLKKFSQRTRSVIVLKGAHTSIATPEGNVYFNSSGNPGMAKGGSGDVLLGIITGLLAQGYSSADAAIAGVYVHGLAGDLAASDLGMISMTATDLIEFLPHAFKKVRPNDRG